MPDSVNRSVRLGRKVRHLVTLTEQLARDPRRARECCRRLLGTHDFEQDFIAGASALNNDGCPLQLCLTASREGTSLRAIGDPGAFETTPEQRYQTTTETLARVIARHGTEGLADLAKQSLDLLVPDSTAKRREYTKGFAWLAASPDQPGLAFYLEMAPLGLTAGWEAVERWLEQMLPTMASARRHLQILSKHCRVASAGLEGSTVANSRAKIYFRLLQPTGVQGLGIEMFSAPEMQTFLALAMGAFEVDCDGLVMSIGFHLQSGALADAKIDLCGHCLRHPREEWAVIVRKITDRFSLAPLDPARVFENAEHQVAFIGLGLTTLSTPRLNLYVKHGGESQIPEAEEIRGSLADSLGYLQSVQAADGSWQDYHLPVGPSDQWVTAYAALGLALGGKSLNHPGALEAARKGALWLTRNRTYPAGWGYNGATGPDSDSTAIAIALLDELGLPVAPEDRAFLRDHWRTGEGIATYDGPNAWGMGHWDVTPWGFLGLSSQDQETYRDDFLSALSRHRLAHGFWRSYWWRNPFYSTFTTLEALRTLLLPEPLTPANANLPTQPITIDNPFDLGCYIGIECLRDPSDPRIGGQLRALLNWQATDGRWGGTGNLRVTENQCYEPWNQPEGRYYVDEKALVTTATLCRVLGHVLAAHPTVRSQDEVVTPRPPSHALSPA